MRLKKCKFLGRRGLSVLLSLVLCMGMASPAFAAMDLKEALDEKGNWKSEEDRDAAFVRDEEGKKTTKEEYELTGDLELEKSLSVTGNRDVNIELNGNKLQLNETKENEDGTWSYVDEDNLKAGQVLRVSGDSAKLTITDNTTEKDDDGNLIGGTGRGEISGG